MKHLLTIIICIAAITANAQTYKSAAKGFSVDSTTAIKAPGDKYKGHQVYLSAKKNTPFYVVIDKNGNQHAVYLKKDN
jgi:hypothetical protein